MIAPWCNRLALTLLTVLLLAVVLHRKHGHNVLHAVVLANSAVLLFFGLGPRVAINCTTCWFAAQEAWSHVLHAVVPAGSGVSLLPGHLAFTLLTVLLLAVVLHRKYGHNEIDEPMFTQPLMYKAIRQHKNSHQKYVERLLSEGLDKAQVRLFKFLCTLPSLLLGGLLVRYSYEVCVDSVHAENCTSADQVLICAVQCAIFH